MEWRDLRYVLAVAEGGSWQAAGRQLEVAPTTVGRRVAALEASLGTRLFERWAHGLKPTTAGLQAVEAARVADDAVARFEREVRDRDRSMAGQIRLLSIESMALYYLPAVLTAFRRKHPEVALELLADLGPVDFEGGEADVGVRLSRPEGQGLVSRRVGELAFELYASRRYLASRPKLARGRGFSGHELLLYDRWLRDVKKGAQLTRWLEDARVAVVSNTIAALVPAAVADGGLALLPCFVADHVPGLTRVEAPAPIPSCELWLVVRRAVQRTARIRELVAHLQAAFRADEARLRATQGTARSA